MDFTTVQEYMRGQGIGAWLLYDFRGSNPVFWQLIGGKRWTTRRAFILVPAQGDPVLLAHGIDKPSFAGVSLPMEFYLSWRDLHDWLKRRLSGAALVATEYSPDGALPAVSFIDAGTFDLIRKAGVEVISSENLIQVCVARWSPAACDHHAKACQQVGAIKDEAFGLIRERLGSGKSVTEYEVQKLILDRFKQEGLETPDAPIVAANEHSGDPHFETSEASAVAIKKGDWILIDLWARVPGDENVFCDITWCAFAGDDPSARHREVYETVRRARDACLQRAQDAWKKKERIEGWQLDDAARNVIVEAGYEPYVRHRTGHSLSPGPLVHGMGMNLDNLETHDTREMLPGTGFTIEPGIYLPEFGVRLEIDVYVDPTKGPTVTSVLQDKIVLV
jgi:Xaa-Pro dipeptidase